MKEKKIKAVCFGEILWDVLPDGAVPGGAPMNVAYHLNKLGGNAGMISRIGNDKEGEELLAFLKQQKVPVQGVQTDDMHPTGKVLATPGANHEMQYDIVYPAAWDFISATPEVMQETTGADFFIFGSLAVRHEISRTSLETLLPLVKTKVLDINLRPPYFNKERVEALLHHADFLKLNDNELEQLSGWYSFTGNMKERALALNKRFSINTIIITRGADGAACYINENFYEHPGFKVEVVDTVGSGDSFLAGFLTQYQKGVTPQEALEFACRLGSFIATQKGACPQYALSDIYKAYN